MMIRSTSFNAVALGTALLVGVAPVSAATIYNTAGSGNFQNFDTLENTTGNHSWTQNSTVPGWYLFRSDGGSPSYNGSTGTATAGNFYSFGSTNSTDRALGGVGSGTFSGYIAAAFTNDTNQQLVSFTVGYDGEQWRNGGTSNPNVPAVAQTMFVEYGFGATFASVSTWTAAGSSFNFTSPVFSNTAAAVDGNVAGKVTGLGGTIGSLTWNDGDTLWIRFIENNDSNNDHGLAIDRFSFTANAAIADVPEPATITLSLIGLAGAGLWRRRRRASAVA